MAPVNLGNAVAHPVRTYEVSTIQLDLMHSSKGWQKTTASHLIRPMKMRPSRPLSNLDVKQKDDAPRRLRKKKSSALDIPTRARVRIIDPRLYGPVHLRQKDEADVVVDVTSESSKPVTPEICQVNPLKDMFKPREDEGPLSHTFNLHPRQLTYRAL